MASVTVTVVVVVGVVVEWSRLTRRVFVCRGLLDGLWNSTGLSDGPLLGV